ncbi:MAG: hypothetical protein Q9227_006690 [Pyrenula ochraceoflavens]
MRTNHGWPFDWDPTAHLPSEYGSDFDGDHYSFDEDFYDGRDFSDLDTLRWELISTETESSEGPSSKQDRQYSANQETIVSPTNGNDTHQPPDARTISDQFYLDEYGRIPKRCYRERVDRFFAKIEYDGASEGSSFSDSEDERYFESFENGDPAPPRGAKAARLSERIYDLIAKIPVVDQTWSESAARRRRGGDGNFVTRDTAAKRTAFKQWKDSVIEIIGERAWDERSEKRETRRQEEQEAMSNDLPRGKKEARWQKKYGPMWRVRMNENEAAILKGQQRKEERERLASEKRARLARKYKKKKFATHGDDKKSGNLRHGKRKRSPSPDEAQASRNKMGLAPDKGQQDKSAPRKRKKPKKRSKRVKREQNQQGRAEQ